MGNNQKKMMHQTPPFALSTLFTADLLMQHRGGQITGPIGEEPYALRKTDDGGNKDYWAIGGDRIGAMDGEIHLGEIAAAVSQDHEAG